MSVKTRVYVVDAPDGVSALVRASSKNAAINFKARKYFTCSVASQDILIEALQSGAKIETAIEELPPAELLDPAAAAAPAATPPPAPPVAEAPPQRDAFLEGITKDLALSSPAAESAAAAQTQSAPEGTPVRRRAPPPTPAPVVEVMDLSNDDDGEIL